jgi:hypothetical protein
MKSMVSFQIFARMRVMQRSLHSTAVNFRIFGNHTDRDFLITTDKRELKFAILLNETSAERRFVTNFNIFRLQPHLLSLPIQ